MVAILIGAKTCAISYFLADSLLNPYPFRMIGITYDFKCLYIKRSEVSCKLFIFIPHKNLQMLLLTNALIQKSFKLCNNYITNNCIRNLFTIIGRTDRHV